MIFPAQIKNKVITFSKDKFWQFLTSQKDGRYLVVVERVRAKRSNPQNNLWHGPWNRIIADELGYIVPQDGCQPTKIALGMCHTETDKITKKRKWICPSTAKMNVSDMTDFLMRVETFYLSEFNIKLPSKEVAGPY